MQNNQKGNFAACSQTAVRTLDDMKNFDDLSLEDHTISHL